MPPAFEFPTSTNVEVWTPLAFDPKDLHGALAARPIAHRGRAARRRRHAWRRRRRSSRCWPRRIAAAHPDSNAGWGARVVAAHEQLVAQSRPALLVLMGAVAFLLLIVCANMANLLLARASSRRREIAVRGALGAGRWEVARPMLAESLLLAAGGGVLGLLAAVGGLRLLAALPAGELPRLEQIQPRRRRAASFATDRVAGGGAAVRRAAGAARRRRPAQPDARVVGLDRQSLRPPRARAGWSSSKWRWRWCCSSAPG